MSETKLETQTRLDKEYASHLDAVQHAIHDLAIFAQGLTAHYPASALTQLDDSLIEALAGCAQFPDTLPLLGYDTQRVLEANRWAAYTARREKAVKGYTWTKKELDAARAQADEDRATLG